MLGWLRTLEVTRKSLSARRAWIEMPDSTHRREPFPQSLSARRAWIEMRMALFPVPATMVALRKESVDRNNNTWWVDIHTSRSLSARRAWIEILISNQPISFL